MKGLIFGIQRYSIHDGKGIRTLVFLKGCPLKCLWCSNPEGINPYPELMIIGGRCIYDECTQCLKVCPYKAVKANGKGKLETTMKLCKMCKTMDCAKGCNPEARVVVGKWMTIPQVLDEIEKDRVFYENSGGGATLGGGEPTLQPQFALEILRICRERMIDTAIETCGHTNWKYLKKMSEYSTLIFYDLKLADPISHRRFTGMGNKVIIDNAKRLSNLKRPMIIRIPIIPGYTDSEVNVKTIVEFASTLDSVETIELLPYHRYGMHKYRQLGRKNMLEDIRPPAKEHMKNLEKIVKSYFS